MDGNGKGLRPKARVGRSGSDILKQDLEIPSTWKLLAFCAEVSHRLQDIGILGSYPQNATPSHLENSHLTNQMVSQPTNQSPRQILLPYTSKVPQVGSTEY